MSSTFKSRLRRARMMKCTAAIGAPVAALISFLIFLRLTSSSPVEELSDNADVSLPVAIVGTNLTPRLVIQEQSSQTAANLLLASIEPDIDADRRAEIIERIAQSADSDPLKLLEPLLGRNDATAVELRQLIVRRWAEAHPQAAAAWASRLPEGAAQAEAMSQIAIAWGDADLNATVTWANSLPESAGKQVALSSLAYEAARTAPETSLALATSLPPTLERDTLLVHAVSQWASANSSAAIAWAENVPDPNLRERLIAAVAVALANQDGSAAAQLAAGRLGPGEEQDRAVVSIVQRWAQSFPRAAVSWVKQFPNSSLREAALQSVAALGPPVAASSGP